MLSALPFIAPRDAHTLWYTSSSTASFSPTPLQSGNQQSQIDETGERTSTKRGVLSPLAQLEHDEQELEARKRSIQLFGSTWIKPPGIPKTLQMVLDEEAELENDERELEAGMEEGGFMDEMEEDLGEEDEEGADEVDLDAEVPEGEDVAISDDETVDQIDQSIFSDQETISDLEEGAEEAELDLDAEVPEAEADTFWEEESGSEDDFESESEDSSSAEERGTPAPATRALAQTPAMHAARENQRARNMSSSPHLSPARAMWPQQRERYASSSPQYVGSSPQQLLFSGDDRVRGAEYAGNLDFTRRRISGQHELTIEEEDDEDGMEVDDNF